MTVDTLPGRGAVVFTGLRSERIGILERRLFWHRGILQHLRRKNEQNKSVRKGYPTYRKCGETLERPGHSPNLAVELTALPKLVAVGSGITVSSHLRSQP